MKARHFIIPAMILLAACQQMEVENPNAKESKEPAAEAEQTAILTVEASKGEADTKALDLTNEGNRLNVYWTSSEKVQVYKGGTHLGELTVTPGDGVKPTTATLSGDINVSGLSAGNELTLILPRDSWNYTGQNGVLTGTGTIEDTYAYSLATITIESISGSSIVPTGKASFANEQSIYRLAFQNGSTAISVKDFTISATNGKLVQSRTFSGGAWTSTFGSLVVTPAAATNQPLYMALRNESDAEDNYKFVITGSDDALYLGNKTIPVSVLGVQGKFINATISATKTTLAPMASGVISTSSEVY